MLTHDARRERVVHERAQVRRPVEHERARAARGKTKQERGLPRVLESEERHALPVREDQQQRERQRPAVVVEKQREGIDRKLLSELPDDDDVSGGGHCGREGEDVAREVEGEVAGARDETAERGGVDGELDAQAGLLLAHDVVEQEDARGGGAAG